MGSSKAFTARGKAWDLFNNGTACSTGSNRNLSKAHHMQRLQSGARAESRDRMQPVTGTMCVQMHTEHHTKLSSHILEWPGDLKGLRYVKMRQQISTGTRLAPASAHAL